MSKTNTSVDVFRLINMLTGPEYTDPETGEVTRCWPFTGKLNSEGRPYIQIDGKKKLAYRVVYEAVTGEELGDRIFRHKCDNEICCNWRHGIPGDHVENMKDMKERERHGMPHHTVRHIKKLIAAGISDADIAKRFGCGRSTIYDIRVGNTYDHVTGEGKDEET
jgi:hypothetical protein